MLSGTYKLDFPAGVFPGFSGIRSCPRPFPVPFCLGPKISETVKPFTTCSPPIRGEPKVRSKGSRPTRRRLVLTLAWLLIHHLQPATSAPRSSFPIIMEMTGSASLIPKHLAHILNPNMYTQGPREKDVGSLVKAVG